MKDVRTTTPVVEASSLCIATSVQRHEDLDCYFTSHEFIALMAAKSEEQRRYRLHPCTPPRNELALRLMQHHKCGSAGGDRVRLLVSRVAARGREHERDE